ncbi:MAG: DNA-directed RNA polymerase subunit alpha [Fimbriimonadales bacterium]|nr:MAG: DNA-directed RNA polymerase subunit alpha [Armatimonadota bacterium]MBV6502666.1 DNA-directed RNA polymerase subunit alpha [Fimbriimonadales bacterium]MCE7898486.1 DNA-directed RNA polymerase subunit alpha [Armatimonadetes bacterium ATM1]MDL1928221.1 DNA-directed RNA polymerase subunit alpha [Fimbriimonadia bacterium ATM]MBC6968675.1 DNA-directed RNA polymerase subunit alpha [Armatimonadota bacterium]
MTNVQTLELNDTYGKFVLTPLERGYGQTIGNALRRVLLSSIPGAAITAVRVEKVLHEFAPIPGVKEDMNELLLNLRDVAIRIHRDRPPEEDYELIIDVKGPGRVTAADIQCPPEVEIMNPECYLCTLSDQKATLYMELYVGWGTGYVMPDKHEKYKGRIGFITMGSQYTPVRKVNYTVEATRVGQRTDYERLTIEVETTAAVAPNVAVSQAAEILDRYFKLFFDLSENRMDLGLDGPDDEPSELDGVPDIRVEEMEFSQRTFNCLRRANIDSLRDLLRYSDVDLMAIRGFGSKALDEVREKLQERGYALKTGTGRDAVRFDAFDEMD